MEAYRPQEIVQDGRRTGRWHFVQQVYGRISAVGYCAPYVRCPVCAMTGLVLQFAGVPEDSPPRQPRDCRRCQGAGRIPVLQPCLGHDTPQAASRHFRQYLLDCAEYRVRRADEPTPYGDNLARPHCQAPSCQSPADWLAHVWPSPRAWVALCEAHCRPDWLDAALPDTTQFTIFGTADS